MDLAPVTTNRADGADGLRMGAMEVIGVKITIAKKRYPYHQYTTRDNQTRLVALTWTDLDGVIF